jgi:hypothetical protein
MASGGARARSGPAPDPNALRRDRADDKAWVDLPAEGFAGEVPEFPLPDALVSEVSLWAELWRKPQAAMWDALGLKWQVAAYVRAFVESVQEKASAGLKTAVLRMEAELGLSTVGMGQLRWRIASDELAAKRDEVKTPERSSARDRLKALDA